MKKYLKKAGVKSKTVVTTVMSNLGLEKYLKDGLGIKLIRTKVGGFNKGNSINVKDFKDWLLYQQHSQN